MIEHEGVDVRFKRLGFASVIEFGVIQYRHAIPENIELVFGWDDVSCEDRAGDKTHGILLSSVFVMDEAMK